MIIHQGNRVWGDLPEDACASIDNTLHRTLCEDHAAFRLSLEPRKDHRHFLDGRVKLELRFLVPYSALVFCPLVSVLVALRGKNLDGNLCGLTMHVPLTLFRSVEVR